MHDAGECTKLANAPIDVFGLLGDDLPAQLAARLRVATLVVGGARHLKRAGVEPEAPTGAPPSRHTVLLSGDLQPALTALAAHEGPAVVLASGDPGFFGIVRALQRDVGANRLRVHPAASSVAAAFAHLGLPWEDAVVVSAHGRDPRTALNVCRAHPKVAVFTAPDFTPSTLGASLAASPETSTRIMVIAERLGELGETYSHTTPAKAAVSAFADPNVVLVLDPRLDPGLDPGSTALRRAVTFPSRLTPHRWALPDRVFERRRGTPTKAEVRAVILAWLGPGLGDLVWDVGSGSGTVGVECARHGAAVIAVEHDEDACGLTRRNAARHGVTVDVRAGEAKDILPQLPLPDAVFVGGAGDDLELVGFVARQAQRVVVVALARLEPVAGALGALQEQGLQTEAILLQAARLAALGNGHRLAPVNPVFLLCGRRDAGGNPSAVAAPPAVASASDRPGLPT